jgi:hypothetical protein
MLLGAAIAHLHWPPDQFWRATNHEFQAAQEAMERANKAAEKRAREGSKGIKHGR